MMHTLTVTVKIRISMYMPTLSRHVSLTNSETVRSFPPCKVLNRPEGATLYKIECFLHALWGNSVYILFFKIWKKAFRKLQAFSRLSTLRMNPLISVSKRSTCVCRTLWQSLLGQGGTWKLKSLLRHQDARSPLTDTRRMRHWPGVPPSVPLVIKPTPLILWQLPRGQRRNLEVARHHSTLLRLRTDTRRMRWPGVRSV